jgi:hypothetical protein
MANRKDAVTKRPNDLPNRINQTNRRMLLDSKSETQGLDGRPRRRRCLEMMEDDLAKRSKLIFNRRNC